MAAYLSGINPDQSARFILAEVPGLYLYLRPFALKKPRVALQKSAASLTGIHGIAVAHQDWSAYRRASEEDGRVFPSDSFEAFSRLGTSLPTTDGSCGFSLSRGTPPPTLCVKTFWVRRGRPRPPRAPAPHGQLRKGVGMVPRERLYG
ncbi:unnamed protein product [Chondrus crispus]|uniref:Uncharacterized protein n=1 Tax=Chondrus crispus TaxID=2769 RepID=R7QD19_CHOCR|nr:unnamed protein product [Chondrus crispus]CDF35331.1 unnamed protein product [Chondrus crispus]|eukprot:XP_005715150.1 unnamed protein product [Chondrus crispus]